MIAIRKVNEKITSINRLSLPENKHRGLRILPDSIFDEIGKLQKEKEQQKDTNTVYQQYIKKGIDLLSTPLEFYNKADLTTKRRIVGSIFPEKLFLTK